MQHESIPYKVCGPERDARKESFLSWSVVSGEVGEVRGAERECDWINSIAMRGT